MTSCGSTTQVDGPLEFEALLAGVPIADSGPTRRIRLEPDGTPDLTILVTNRAATPVDLAQVRLEGRMMGLTFLSYVTGLHETMQPGEDRVLRFPIELFDLDHSAHGLLRGRVVLVDDGDNVVGARSVVLDGRGSPRSSMALFTIALVIIAAASVAINAYRHRVSSLPGSALLRMAHFSHSGVFVGLALAAVAATIRMWPPADIEWLGLTVVVTAASLVLGFLAPEPDGGMHFPTIDLTDEPNESKESITISTY